MVRFLGEELRKEYFVNRYVQLFKKFLLFGDVKKLTAREESLLELEKECSEMFYDAFKRQHGRSPDEMVLSKLLKDNFLKRSRLFMRSSRVIDEENFILSHLDQLKRRREMKRELFVVDGYSHVLEREKKLARDYFRKHDDYPDGYEELIISRSITAVNQGLEKLMINFMESYRFYYRDYVRRD